MKIAIAGGSGFVGTALSKKLLAEKHDLYILTRKRTPEIELPGVHYVQWLKDSEKPELELEGIDAFINLAGESLNNGRWTNDRKRKIVESRIASTKEMNRILSVLKQKPQTVINASAIGYYGISNHQSFIEDSESLGDDFLAKTVKLWEKEALKAQAFSSRIVLTRFGVILGEKYGALPMMVLPYKLFAGGTIGKGQQWVSWIHLSDCVNAIIFCLNNNELKGPVNFTSPHPVQMKDFGKIIGTTMNRPHWFPVPPFMLKLALGEMSILVLEGQKVLPKALLDHGFTFSYPDLHLALEEILNK